MYIYNKYDVLIKSENVELTEEMLEEIIQNAKQLCKKNEIIEEITVEFKNDELEATITYLLEGISHIRRITGYLVGTLDKFNDGKKCEENDRVKHI